MSAWILLFAAIFFEITATLMLKLSDGFERWHWALASMAAYALCFYAFAPALKHIPIGIAYAMWAGLGIVGMAIIGWVGFDERLSLVQSGFVTLIVLGTVGLRITTPA